LFLVLTTVTSSAHPVGNVDFPAFTICGEGSIGDTIVAGLIKEFFYFLKSKLNITVEMTPFEASQLISPAKVRKNVNHI
jgi:hypothetical protein